MIKSVRPKIRFYPNLDKASRAVAENLVEMAQAVVREKGRFTLALAGGDTPRHLFSLLASAYSNRIPWSSIHLFWSDERYVPRTHPDSNFAMAFDALISKVSIPPQNVHRIPTETESPEKAATTYEELLREFFPDEATHTFDLMLLGMGEDGHTASLFPCPPLLEEKERWVSVVTAPSATRSRIRITLTLPVINKASSIFFLVSGARKMIVVKSILKDYEAASKLYPAAMVHPIDRLVWFVADYGAANNKH
jgi:6-phosphogluconolactonase